MKILHTVEFYYPSIGGAQEVVKQISERLVQLGHEVTVASSKQVGREALEHNGVKIVEFDVAGNVVNGFSGQDVEKYKQFLTESKFDLVMNYAAQQWATDLFFEAIDQVNATKVLVPCGFSGLKNPSYKKYFEKMPEILRKYDATVYGSNDYQDIIFAQEHGIKNLHLIPNGADEREFLNLPDINIRGKLKIPNSNSLILLVGSHTGLKGHLEAMDIFKTAKLKNATLLIVANNFDGGCTRTCHRVARLSRFSPGFLKSGRRILVKNLSRPETLAAYGASDVFLFPSKIEMSPLVLFESAAARLPFLTSDAGNAREIIEWTGGGELLPTSKDDDSYSCVDIARSAKQLEKLLSNPGKMKKYGQQGYDAWMKKFNWAVISKQYEKLYYSIAETKK